MKNVSEKSKKLGNPVGIASLIVSGVALIGSWIPLFNVISMVLGVAGIIVGLISLIMVMLKKAGMIILPILGVVFGIISICLGVSVNNSVFGSTSSESSSSSSSSQIVTQKDDAKSSKQENKSKEYKVGDVISWEGKEITVTDVDKKYTPKYSTAKSGKEFIKVTLNVVNKSDKDKAVSPLNFKVQDSTCAQEAPDGSTYSLSDQFESATLVSGGSRKGSIVFEVNKDDENLKLICTSDNILSDDKIEIKL